jgi:hypothetical protein
MNTETPKMPRWQYFSAMGNNCRVNGMNLKEAEIAVESALPNREDYEYFWTGYQYGKSDEVQALPSRSEIV